MSTVPGFYQWVIFTQESAYGVYNSGGTTIWMRLVGDDSFSPNLVPARTVIRSADGYNRRVQNISARYSITASLKTKFWPTQANTILGAATTLVGSGDPTLTSWTADHFDGQAIRRYLGGMIQSLDMSSNAEQQDSDLSINWIFQQKSDTAPSTLPAPTAGDFPSENPYLHTQLGGNFTIGSTPVAITQFNQFQLKISNILAPRFYELPYISLCQWGGRDIDLMTNLTYVDTSWRGYYEAQTPLTLVAEYVAGSHSCQFHFQTVSIVSERSVTRPLAGVMEQGVTVQAFYDPTSSSDFSFTAS